MWTDTIPGPRQRLVYRRSAPRVRSEQMAHVSTDHVFLPTATIERATSWPATRLTIDEVVAYLERVLPVESPAASERRRRVVPRLLGWLSSFPGETWQQRWQQSGLAARGKAWTDDAAVESGHKFKDVHASFKGAMSWLLAGDLIRPNYEFLYDFASTTMLANARRLRDPDGFVRLDMLCTATPRLHKLDRAHAFNQLARILIHNGGTLAEITVADCIEAYRHQVNSTARQQSFWYVLLRQAAILPVDAPPTIWAASRAGRLDPATLVDRYSLKCRPVRDLIVAYLEERQAAMDFSSVNQLATKLACNFWGDLERHHPGIDSLHLTPDMTRAWKERLQTVNYGPKKGRRREDPNTIHLAVRGFYADIAAWAQSDPDRWSAWVAPSPISPRDLIGQNKAHHKATARMQQRTRELAPHLPRLVETVTARKTTARARLDTAAALTPGEVFHIDGETFTVATLAGDASNVPRPGVVYARDTTGRRRNLNLEHREAFMCWAVVEVFRHTGIRREELLELTHRSLVAYTLPSTGETIPLLHITPSKTDRERLIVVSPELADVLAELIAFVSGPDGRVPLVIRYDVAERVHSQALPFLFQLPHGLNNQVLTGTRITKMLTVACEAGRIVTNDGQALRFSSHDFRRVFATEAVAAGLPVHITAKLLGHLSLNTTQGYVAVYDRDVIEHHQAFIARRRTMRPSAEYREPTDTEWDEFLGHFTKRRVALGTCARPYGTPCIHEHACIRCPLLRLDHQQRDRLVEIITNLEARLVEAETEHWHGEIDAITTSLTAAKAKLDSIPPPPSRPTRSAKRAGARPSVR